jgi:hypothetical protein
MSASIARASSRSLFLPSRRTSINHCTQFHATSVIILRERDSLSEEGFGEVSYPESVLPIASNAVICSIMSQSLQKSSYALAFTITILYFGIT